MSKAHFGEILHKARSDKGMSLRQLSAQSGIEFTRLSRMEHGTRPAPGLPQMRQLAELLSLNLVDLLVSAGTPREAVEQLLWAERLQQARRVKTLSEYSPEGHRAGLKNDFSASVVSRKGALCTVRLGSALWSILAFSDAPRLRVMIPPEAIQIFAQDPTDIMLPPCNIFPAVLNKIRNVGTLQNLVLGVGGIELNALVVQQIDASLNAGSNVFISVSPVAPATEPLRDRRGEK